MSDGEVVARIAEAVRFQRDLYLYWRSARMFGPLALTTRGYVNRPMLRRIRETLVSADGIGDDGALRTGQDKDEVSDGRVFFLRRLLQRLGLLRLATGEHEDDGEMTARRRTGAHDVVEAAQPEIIARYLAHPLEERLRICLRLWVAGGWWQDQAEPGAPPRVMVPALPRVALARRRLTDELRLLAETHDEGLHTLPAQVAVAQRRAGGRERRTMAADIGKDAHTESGLRRAALVGPLAWLGVVALSGADSYRVTEAALALRPPEQDGSSEGEVVVERHGRVTIQPDYSVIAYPPLTAPALALLDGCAAEQSLDKTARYRLTREAFGRALRMGWEADATIRQLEILAGAALPQNVRATLEDWRRQDERLRFTDGARVLVVDDAALLDALLADQGAAGWVERRVGPTVALLAPEREALARAWLLRRGRLPAFERFEGGAGAPGDEAL